MINPRQRASDQTLNSFPLDPLLNPEDSIDHHYAENLLTAHNDGIIGINKQGYITFINKTACKLTGWTSADTKNQKIERFFNLTSNFSTQSNIELITSVIKSGRIFGPINNHCIQTKKDDDLQVHFSLSPVDQDTIILMFHPLLNKNNQLSHSLLYQASHDPLTRIKNRYTIQKTISLLHNQYKKKEKNYSLFLLNIDRFKLINDCYSHKTGDQLLQLIADRIQHSLRDKDSVGRWSGEEFICLLPDTDIKIACKVAQRICDIIAKQPFLTENREISATASIGVANFPFDANNPDVLFSITDATLYEAKKNGRNRIHSSQQVTGNIYSIGSQLENALNEKRITPVYQPIFELSSGKKVAEEALARIQDKQGELIEAHEFIDAAIELQMIHRVDYQIIMKMISRCTEQFLESNISLPHFVNVSADLLRHPKLVKKSFSLLKTNVMNAGKISVGKSRL